MTFQKEYIDLINIFYEQFGEVVDRHRLSSEIYEGKVLPEELPEFYNQVGIGRRSDGFLWLIDLNRLSWMRDIFHIEGHIPLQEALLTAFFTG